MLINVKFVIKNNRSYAPRGSFQYFAVDVIQGAGFGLRLFLRSAGKYSYPVISRPEAESASKKWRNTMDTPNTLKKEKLSLLWHFLKGSKRYFLISILSAAVTALADMLQPQIIRAAVDCAIGGKEADFPPFVMALVDRFGGFAYIRWIPAINR